LEPQPDSVFHLPDHLIMSRYSFEDAEDPFDNPHNVVPAQQPRYQSPPNVVRPGQHPESTFDRLRAQRHSRQNSEQTIPLQTLPLSTSPPPIVPAHRDQHGRIWGRELGYSNSTASATTPGADNFGEGAAGGLAGIAHSIADTHPRESGMEAARNTPGYDPRQENHGYDAEDIYSSYDTQQAPLHNTGYDPRNNMASPGSYHDTYRQAASYDGGFDHAATARPDYSQGSLTPLGASMMPPASVRSRSPHDFSHTSSDPYSDMPYNRHSRNLDPMGADFDPNSIADDGDDGLVYEQRHRGSMLSVGQNSDRGLAAGVVGGAAAGGVLGTIGGLVGRNKSGGQSSYNPVNPQTAYDGANGHYAPSAGGEKSEWLKKQSGGNKKLKWIVGIIVVLAILAGIGAGVAIPLINKKNSNNDSSNTSTSTGQTAADDESKNGDLTKDSKEIKALMNNKNLHKVFPGMDYTPINTQYPDCLKWPPSQNNVTRDVAVLSQLTNIVRLYGTDCNQTEMLMHSIDALGLNGTMTVWLGVWQDTNTTTNARQLSQMYEVLKKYGPSSFEGVIVGNEMLFREDISAADLGTLLDDVRTNFTNLGYDLPVATSDLGDKWTAELATKSDYVMSNVHPFFSGVEVEVAAAWTWSFWQGKDSAFKSDTTKNIISETGWPSGGGTDCGGATSCTNGSVAGISEMNDFMNDWVCQALTNGTNYFWFEAFDEPWKIKYNTAGEEWEDKWGLLDIDRNLKDGLKIPDCGGKTVS
jgi:exo-beta-1,3-glucanase (GH17 family)